MRYSAPSHDPIGLPSKKRLSMDDTDKLFAMAFEEFSKGLFLQS
jgi:hypothetical protein